MNQSRYASLSASMWGIGIITISLALVAGFVVTIQPLVVIPLAGITVLLVLNALGHQTERLFLISLSCLLIGFLFYSKAFSYIGVAPLYISEPVLLLGILSLVFGRVRLRLSGLHLLIFAFLLLGLIHTVPYVSQYGIDALRDAATWYYALFAVILSALLAKERLHCFLSIFARLLPILVVWLATMSLFFRFAPAALRLPDAEPSAFFYTIKPSDRAIILVGIATFVVSGLYDQFRKARRNLFVILWPLWSICALLAIVASRGGMLAIAVAFAAVVSLRPSRQLFQAGIAGVILLLILLLVNPTIEFGRTRSFSIDQIRVNVVSIFSDDTGDIGAVQHTKDWRLEWWESIIDQTVKGPYFWSGQGFGINLADEYGFQNGREHSLRSPHSIHFTILARMGIPGFLLWVGINVAFANQVVQVHRRTRRENQLIVAEVAVWLLALWAAILVSASFDVYLESPHGAIPFWCVVGAGMALPAVEQVSARPDP